LQVLKNIAPFRRIKRVKFFHTEESNIVIWRVDDWPDIIIRFLYFSKQYRTLAKIQNRKG